MKTGRDYSAQIDEGIEKISARKLRLILTRNWMWLVAILFLTNLGAYLYIRWTKPLYEATSEIKLDIESDAQEFGIGGLVEDKNMGILSGEIELLKSRLFFQKLLDSLDLSISYYTQGRILVDEKYPNGPFKVDYSLKDNTWVDKRILLEFLSPDEFTYKIDDGAPSEPYRVGSKVENESISFTVSITQPDFELTEEKFLFIINSNEALQNYLDANLNVEFLNLKANTLQISFQDHNTAKAKDIVNTINKIYIHYTQNERSRANKNKIEWIDDQLSKIENELEDFENYFENFTIENRTNDLDNDLKITVQSINQLDSQRFEVNRRLSVVNTLLSELDSSGIIIPSRLLPTDIRDAVIDLNDLHIEKQQLGISYKETTFTMQSKDQEIAALKDGIKSLVQEYHKNLKRNEEDLNRRKSNLESSFTKIPGKSTEFNKNQRFYKLYEEFYLSLMQSKAEFEIAVAGITPNFKILEPAKVNQNPVEPNKLVVQGSGVTSGLLICLLFIGFRYVVEDKINSVEEVEELLAFPIMGNIPKARVNTDGGLITFEHPKSSVSEALRSTRTNIQFFVPEQSSQVITVTSSIAGEGKTFIASNLAAILALSNKKVCVLDLDMRKPSVHARFNHLENGKGVSTLLISKHALDECITTTEVDGLHYIPAGPIPPNPSELLMNGNFNELLSKLKESYDIVILDTPPVGLVTDGILAMKQSDLTIMVVRNGHTRKRDIKGAMRHLNLVDKKISVVFNGHESRGTYGYSYGYYSDKKSS